jgi:hypothetical protein
MFKREYLTAVLNLLPFCLPFFFFNSDSLISLLQLAMRDTAGKWIPFNNNRFLQDKKKMKRRMMRTF